jgi:hypothetical protein
MLAGHGALAFALGYFGGPGEPPGICEVPLETIGAALDALVEEGCEHVAILGGVQRRGGRSACCHA